MPITTAAALVMSEEKRVELARMAASSVLPYRQVVQARALLWAGEGVANEEIARRSGVDSDTVRRWRKRFAEKGTAGVGVIAEGRGRGSWLPPGTVQEVLRLTRTQLPADGSTQWTTRSLAARVGIGKDTVARIWADHNLKPWKVETFKVSNDPRFEDKLVDVVGLYLNPPVRAVVFSFDEKTQCQALDRTQPSLPLKAGAGRHDDPRLQAQRHDRPVRGDEPCHRPGAHRVPQDPQGRRRVAVLQADRRRGAARAERARGAGGPVRAQRAGGDQVAGAQGPAPVAPAFHTHILVLAEFGGAVVQGVDRQAAASGTLHQRR